MVTHTITHKSMNVYTSVIIYSVYVSLSAASPPLALSVQRLACGVWRP